MDSSDVSTEDTAGLKQYGIDLYPFLFFIGVFLHVGRHLHSVEAVWPAEFLIEFYGAWTLLDWALVLVAVSLMWPWLRGPY